MKLFKSRMGIVTHPAVMFLTAFVLGLVAAYLWINFTTVWNPFCGK